jgi:hypothetical protein
MVPLKHFPSTDPCGWGGAQSCRMLCGQCGGWNSAVWAVREVLVHGAIRADLRCVTGYM